MMRFQRCKVVARHGYLYLAVLFTTLLVASLVAATLALSTSQMRVANGRVNREAALQLAESELQLTSARMQKSVSWRSSLSNQTYSAWRTLGSGRVRHQFQDLDGSLTDDLFDDVTLCVHAEVGDAAVAIQAQLTNRPVSVPLLKYAITARDDLAINNGMHVSTESPVQVADDYLTNNFGFLIAPRLDKGDLCLASVYGDTGTANVTLPTWNVLDQLKSMGTEINRSSLPIVSGKRFIQNTILSSTYNPFGTVNANGIYWIDGGGQEFEIRNSRIEGTLVLVNEGVVTLSGALLWNSLDGNRVALAVTNDLTINNTTNILNEATIGVNFNPSHTPNRIGLSNDLVTDTYAGILTGLFYSEKNVNILPSGASNRLDFQGAIVGTNVTVSGNVSIAQVPTWITHPPLGFREPTALRWASGSFRIIATPN